MRVDSLKLSVTHLFPRTTIKSFPCSQAPVGQLLAIFCRVRKQLPCAPTGVTIAEVAVVLVNKTSKMRTGSPKLSMQFTRFSEEQVSIVFSSKQSVVSQFLQSPQVAFVCAFSRNERFLLFWLEYLKISVTLLKLFLHYT